MHLQLQNTSPVVAEWDFKKAMGSSKDEAKFRLEPRGGVLQPGQRCNVAVEFVPLEHRGHALKLPLKVNQSPKTKLIAFSGSGVQANVVFDPPLIDLGPILPYSAGDAGTVTMTNNSERPVEVYALDFDLGYLEEEEVLHFQRCHPKLYYILTDRKVVGEPRFRQALGAMLSVRDKVDAGEVEGKEADAMATSGIVAALQQ